MRTKHLSEKVFSKQFESAVANGAWAAHYDRFSRVVPEVECQQGRPDFVASQTPVGLLPRSLRLRYASVLSKPSAARVMALLKPSSPRGAEYLRRATGLSVSIIDRSLGELESARLIERAGTGYVVAPRFATTRWELWAFEVKLADWRRALFQGLQYRSFADRVIIVMPERWAHRAERHSELFKRLKIGLLAVDEGSSAIRVIVPPRKTRPGSRFHHLNAVGRFLDESRPQKRSSVTNSGRVKLRPALAG